VLIAVESSFKIDSQVKKKSLDHGESTLRKRSGCRSQLSLSFFATEGDRQFRTCNLEQELYRQPKQTHDSVDITKTPPSLKRFNYVA